MQGLIVEYRRSISHATPDALFGTRGTVTAMFISTGRLVRTGRYLTFIFFIFVWIKCMILVAQIVQSLTNYCTSSPKLFYRNGGEIQYVNKVNQLWIMSIIAKPNFGHFAPLFVIGEKSKNWCFLWKCLDSFINLEMMFLLAVWAQ